MEKQDSNTLFNKDAWKAIIVAVLIVALAAGVLSWQYKKITEKSEEKLSSLEDVMEQLLAQGVLDQFIEARINKNENQANLYLTEQAMEQKIQGEFTLINNFKSYLIQKSEEVGENQYRFIVKLYEEDEMGEIIEVITLTKILDKYYIDLVELAG